MNTKRNVFILSFRNQQGLTLIEIMVALLIGVFLLAGVIQIFIVNKQTYRVQEDLSRMQENGRFAMDYLSRYIRLSGYVENQEFTNPSNLVYGAQTDTCESLPIKGGNNTDLSNISDNVTVRFKADPDDYNPITDCLGRVIGKGATATNKFFLKLDSDSIPTLYCTAGNDLAKNDREDPVIDNVENMQVRYCEKVGKDNFRCITSDKVADWPKVRSVRISLLIRSAHDGLVSQPQPYQWDADGDGKDDDPPPTPTDRRLRRVFTTTISLRNACFL